MVGIGNRFCVICNILTILFVLIFHFRDLDSRVCCRTSISFSFSIRNFMLMHDSFENGNKMSKPFNYWFFEKEKKEKRNVCLILINGKITFNFSLN